MHFDQFNAVKKKQKKKNNCISLPLTHFQGSHHAHFQTKTIDKSIAFFQIYWSIIVDQIHTDQLL